MLRAKASIVVADLNPLPTGIDSSMGKVEMVEKLWVLPW
jgi:hypothetical protein